MTENDRLEMPEYLAVGRIIRPHGVRGEMVVEAYTDLLAGVGSNTLILVGDEHRQMQLRRIRSHRGRLLLQVDEVNDRNIAEGFRGLEIFLHSNQVEPLPEGEFYYWQIVGLDVFEESGKRLGSVKQILETGANDVYLIEGEDGQELLLPAIEQVILEIDLEKSRISVHLLPGLIK